MLLHGFPETHLMWREVAPRLAEHFTVFCFDLPGYGESDGPAPAPDHMPHSKRALAARLVTAMESLGLTRFGVVGHDRGARVAYRMAIDHTDRVENLAVFDILPTGDAWRAVDASLAIAFWPWSLLAQATPLPERVLTRCADEVVASAIAEWGSRPQCFPETVRRAYADALRKLGCAEAICEEYRAAADIDRRHDDEDIAKGRPIVCPTLALWGRGGAVDGHAGGALAAWSRWCAGRLEGQAIDGGHFFPEEVPEIVAARILHWLES